MPLSDLQVTFEECEHSDALYLQKGSWCHCAANSGEKDSLVLCLQCGSGYVFKDQKWIKVLSFDQDALREILGLVKELP